MTRQELMESPEYWLTDACANLWREATRYLQENNLDWSDLVDLGIPKKTVKMLRDGDLEPGPEYYEVACRLGYQPVLELRKNKEVP
jgi:hypothetical protein